MENLWPMPSDEYKGKVFQHFIAELERDPAVKDVVTHLSLRVNRDGVAWLDGKVEGPPEQIQEYVRRLNEYANAGEDK